MVIINKENNISDVDIVENGYFKKTITMSFDLSYSIYKKDKKRFEKDIVNYVEKLGYECTFSVKEKKTKRIRKIDINNSKFINKEGYAMLLSKVNWDDYQEMYRRVENLANICFAGHSSIYEISEAYALIKPLLDTIKERTELIYELDEQIDDEDDF